MYSGGFQAVEVKQKLRYPHCAMKLGCMSGTELRADSVSVMSQALRWVYLWLVNDVSFLTYFVAKQGHTACFIMIRHTSQEFITFSSISSKISFQMSSRHAYNTPPTSCKA